MTTPFIKTSGEVGKNIVDEAVREITAEYQEIIQELSELVNENKNSSDT